MTETNIQRKLTGNNKHFCLNHEIRRTGGKISINGQFNGKNIRQWKNYGKETVRLYNMLPMPDQDGIDERW